jgi:hypothetical protein
VKPYDTIFGQPIEFILFKVHVIEIVYPHSLNLQVTVRVDSRADLQSTVPIALSYTAFRFLLAGKKVHPSRLW